MIKKVFPVVLTFAVLILVAYAIFCYSHSLNTPPDNAIMQKQMTLTSKLFEDGGTIPPAYTCDGEGAPVTLEVSNVSDKARSLALVVNDPDAPSGNFVHWTVWNMPVRTREIVGDLLPENSIEGKNSSGTTGWISPCPPSGTHHYHFTLYSLDTTLALAEGSTSADMNSAMDGHIVESATLIGLYQKNSQ